MTLPFMPVKCCKQICPRLTTRLMPEKRLSIVTTGVYVRTQGDQRNIESIILSDPKVCSWRWHWQQINRQSSYQYIYQQLAYKTMWENLPCMLSMVPDWCVSFAGNKNRTPTAFVSLPAFVHLSPSLSGLPPATINSTFFSGLLAVCGVSGPRRLRSCCSNDSSEDEPDVDLPGVVTTDFSGDRLLTSVEVTPLTSVRSGSSVIPVSLSDSLYNT